MKIYTIIGGVNGVGKSSFTGVLKSRTTDLGVIVDVDKIAVQTGGSALEGGKAAVRIMEDCIVKGVSFTQETTLSGHRTEKTAKRVKEAGYYVRLYYVGLDTAEESKRRIANRVARGGHNINAEDVDRRFSCRWEAVRKVLPYCDEAAFYDNDNGFVQVATYRNGELILEGDYRPAWILELVRTIKDVSTMTEEKLNAELEKGFADIEAGRTRPATQVFAELKAESIPCFYNWDGVCKRDRNGADVQIEEGQCESCPDFCVESWRLEQYHAQRYSDLRKADEL